MPPLPPQIPGSAPATLNYARPMPRRSDLREIAIRQKAIQFCILGQFVLFAILICAVMYALPQALLGIAVLGVIASAITGAIFVFRLALAIYGTAGGIILGVLTCIPLVGGIVLLIVNGKATNLLREDGIHVGLLGARMHDLDGWI
jgi:hypothetical protein